MNVLVIGLGSMGKRRIRLLKQIDSSVHILGIDEREDRCREAESLYGIETKNNLDFVTDGYDLAFVCTAPLSHADLITWCLNQGLHVFTELNLVPDGYSRNMQLAANKGLTLFLSSTFLYRDEITYIRNHVSQSESMLTYSYHVGQYLPDWHPWENYEDYFIGDSRTNGCRELMAIELPWLIKTFGQVVDIVVRKGKKTRLQITCEDSYLLLLTHESGAQGSLLIDVVSRKPVRNLEIFGEDFYLFWDGTPTGLRQYMIDEGAERRIELYQQMDQQEKYAAFVVENAYHNEIHAFLDAVNRGKEAEYGFADDLQTLTLIDRIERSRT